MRAMNDRWTDGFAGRSWRRSRELNLVTHTLALAAQQVLCTAPLLVALSALLRRVGGQGPGVLIPRYLGLTGTAAQDVADLFSRTSDSVSVTTLVTEAALALLFGTGVALTFQRALELVWSLPPAGLRSVARQCTWIVGLVAYLAVVFGVGHGAHRIHGHVHVRLVARVVVQLVASFAFFWWSQRVLLGRRVGWRALGPGAVLIAVGTAVVVGLSGLVLPGQITDQVGDYGLIGGAFVLSIWLVVLSGVVVGGAFLGAMWVQRHET